MTAVVTGGARTFRACWPRAVAALRLLVLPALVLTMGGCSSVGLVYGQASTLSYWWLDRYADFNTEQSTRVRGAIQTALDWHRRQALADDIALFEQLAGEVTQDLSAAQACIWVERLRQRRVAYTARITGAVADVAVTLDARQLRRIAERQASRNEDWRDDHLQPRLADRQEADAKRVRERAELLYGRLDAAQRRAILERLQAPDAVAWDPQRWYAGMLADQAALQAALRGVADSGGAPASREALAAALLRGGAEPDAATTAWREQLQAYQCQVAADLHRRTSPAQRDAAARKLRGWAQDLRAYLPPNAAAATPGGAAAGTATP
ncbi:MAG: hypothetical protein RIQ60_2922 [Pseudomonadota bacterium]